jgi:hypothetical protein
MKPTKSTKKVAGRIPVVAAIALALVVAAGGTASADVIGIVNKQLAPRGLTVDEPTCLVEPSTCVAICLTAGSQATFGTFVCLNVD